MFQNGQKVVVVSSGDPARVIKVQSASGTPDPSRYPIVDTTGVSGRDQSVQIVSGGDPTRFPILRGVSDARAAADAVISALTPAAWYRNATGVTSAGGFASQWDDYSGNARHLVQATGTNQPAYSAGVFTFDGADNNLKTSSFTFDQPATVVLVGKQVTWTGGDYLFDGNATNSCVLYQTGSTPNLQAYAGGANVFDTNPDWAFNTRGILVFVLNGASSGIYLNSSTIGTGTLTATAISGFTLGRLGGAASNFSNITAEEVILIPSALDSTARASLFTVLNALFAVY